MPPLCLCLHSLRWTALQTADTGQLTLPGEGDDDDEDADGEDEEEDEDEDDSDETAENER